MREEERVPEDESEGPVDLVELSLKVPLRDVAGELPRDPREAGFAEVFVEVGDLDVEELFLVDALFEKGEFFVEETFEKAPLFLDFREKQVVLEVLVLAVLVVLVEVEDEGFLGVEKFLGEEDIFVLEPSEHLLGL